MSTHRQTSTDLTSPHFPSGAMTGGPDGMNVPALWVGEWRLTGAVTWYWVSAGALLIAVWLSLNMVESPIGRALRALHGSEIAAETAGIETSRYKVLVFVVSAVFASLAGSLFAHADRFVTPVEAGFLRSIEFVTMVVLLAGFGIASVVFWTYFRFRPARQP